MWGALSERCFSQIVTNKIKSSIYQLESVERSSGGINGTYSTLILGSEDDYLVFLCRVSWILPRMVTQMSSSWRGTFQKHRNANA